MFFFNDCAANTSDYKTFSKCIKQLLKHNKTEYKHKNTLVARCIEFIQDMKDEKTSALTIANKYTAEIMQDIGLLGCIIKEKQHTETTSDLSGERSTDTELFSREFCELVDSLNAHNPNILHKMEVEKLLLKHREISEEKLCRMIRELDDFAFYQYALDHGIEIKKIPRDSNCNNNNTKRDSNAKRDSNINRDTNMRNTDGNNVISLNYKFYECFYQFSPDKHIPLIHATTDYTLLDQIFKCIKIRNWYRENMHKLTDIQQTHVIICINDTIEETDIKQAVSLHKKRLIPLRELIGILLATHKLENIVIALSLLHSYKSTRNTTNSTDDILSELKILFLFLSRFFCLYDDVTFWYRDLRILNIQMYNMAYSWQDPRIILLQEEECIISPTCIKPMILADIYVASVNDQSSFMHSSHKFSLDGSISCAYSCYKTMHNIMHNPILEEYYENKIVSTESQTVFSGYMGEKNRYIFNKLTINRESNNEIDREISKNTSGNTSSNTSGNTSSNIFKNARAVLTVYGWQCIKSEHEIQEQCIKLTGERIHPGLLRKLHYRK